jgi:hypothetical protein
MVIFAALDVGTCFRSSAAPLGGAFHSNLQPCYHSFATDAHA